MAESRNEGTAAVFFAPVMVHRDCMARRELQVGVDG